MKSIIVLFLLVKPAHFAGWVFESIYGAFQAGRGDYQKWVEKL